MSLVWLPEAAQDFDDAVAWYELQQAGLSDRMVAEAANALRLVAQFPQAWHPFSATIRAKRFDRFPYSFVYSQQADASIVLIAFMHQHRRPAYWKNRL